MRTQLSFGLLFAVVLACSMHAAPAQAQRMFVAGTGNDSNPCTFVSPCRTFQHAHDVAATNGEIDVLDPAGYGPVTITKESASRAMASPEFRQPAAMPSRSTAASPIRSV